MNQREKLPGLFHNHIDLVAVTVVSRRLRAKDVSRNSIYKSAETVY
jgi:hypothetical protein